MMKTLTLSPSSDENLRIVVPQQQSKLTNIQEILSINNNNNDNDNSNANITDTPSKPLPFYFGISEILPSLYLCGACAVVRTETLEKLEVKFVVNATVELPDTPLPDSNQPDYMRVAIKDTSESNLIEFFDEVADKIEEIRQKDGKSLVHCVAGVSRSCTLVLAYLMKYSNMSLRQAFQHVRSVRPQVRPNLGFFKQLIEYEERIHGTATVSIITLGEAIIPDVYESEYRAMELLYQKYRRNFAKR